MTDTSSRIAPERMSALLIGLQQSLDLSNDLASLADRFGYSPCHFHRVFSEAVGETPRQHVNRLRLERAAYRLAITSESILDIAFSIGFNSHETFVRAFRRAYRTTPGCYRRMAIAAQNERLRRNAAFRGDGCELSEVRFVTLPAMTLLATRRYGAYHEFAPVPFLQHDPHWTELAAWAERRAVSYVPLAIAISYDDPTLAPGPLQRLDVCVPALVEFDGDDRVRRLPLHAARYACISHVGPLATIDQAYRGVADGIRRSPQHVFDQGPPIQIFREVHVGGDPAANLTDVHFPVRART